MIVADCYIASKGSFANGQKVHALDDGEENWLKTLYDSGKYDYPKFHKMDNLSKMAFLGTELIAKYILPEITENDELQLVFANSNSSAQTDLKFIDSYQNQGNPSPSLFVYTLPNIVTGELSIRHKWFGENIFFINERFDASFFIHQTNFAFKRGNKLCLCAWVDTTMNPSEECFLFLLSAENSAEISRERSAEMHEELTNRINNYRNE